MLRFANTLSVLPKHFLFSSVGPVHPYRRETMARLHTVKLSHNWQLQENIESRQNLFCAPSVLPPLFSQSSVFQSAKHLVSLHLAIIYGFLKIIINVNSFNINPCKSLIEKTWENPQQKA